MRIPAPDPVGTGPEPDPGPEPTPAPPTTPTPAPPTVMHHVTAPATWERAVAEGAFTESTLDRSLEQEGFIHCCDPDQLDFVLTTFYAQVPHDLVVLTIDPDRLTSPWRREVGNPATGETFPHVFGPINPDAVTSTALIHPPHARP